MRVARFKNIFESPDFEFPICSGHTWRSYASGRDSQAPSRAFWSRGPDLFWERSPESRTAQCRRASHWPRSSDRASEELNRGDSHLNHANSTLPGDAIGPRTGKTRSLSSPPDHWTKSRISHPVSRACCSAQPCSRAHNKGEIPLATPCPRRLLIAVPPICVSIRSVRIEIHAAAVEEAR
jgi:hypothetical protein